MIIVQLGLHECINDMSGKKSDYTVIVDVKKKADKIYTSYKGCGYYLKDYRLNDIWVLESINTQALSKTNFVKGFPLLEINFAQKKMFGNTGCNEVNGFMEVQGNKIKFGKLITTYNFCPDRKQNLHQNNPVDLD